MGGPLSVVLSNIFMTMLEMNVVLPMKPTFYKRYVDDIITRRDKNKKDLLLELNNHIIQASTLLLKLTQSSF